jgi:hypothetical protein
MFLHQESRVTIGDAARMLGWTRAELNAAVRDGDVEVVTKPSRKTIELCELELQALQLWSLNAIEDALGLDVALIMPPALRTQSFTIRVPRYQVTAAKSGRAGWPRVGRHDSGTDVRRVDGSEQRAPFAAHPPASGSHRMAGAGEP